MMKNKKLFAILTLMCFMFTLMPVAAFAEGETVVKVSTAKEFAAATTQSNITIEFQNDITGPGVFIEKNQVLTINLGSHTYTVIDPTVGSEGTETQGFHFEGDVTLKNGTIVIDNDATVKMLMQNYGNLKLIDVTLDGTNGKKPDNMAFYTLSNNSGVISITGNTSIIAPVNGVAFDVCDSSYYPSKPVVSVNTSGTIDGAIEVSDTIKNNLTIVAGKFTADPTEYVPTGYCVSKTSPYTVTEKHTAGTAVKENVVEATYVAEGSYDSVEYCSVCGKELSRVAKTIAKLEYVYVPDYNYSDSTSDSTTSAPTVETETVVTPSGTKVETTTTTDANGTVTEVVETTTASGETKTTTTVTLENGSEVVNTNANVELKVEEVDSNVVTDAYKEIATNDNLEMVGGSDSAVSVSASSTLSGADVTVFTEPVDVSVPVSDYALSNVTDTSKLTLAKVVTNADGTTSLEYMGGSYDKATGTFNAKVDEDGDYILVEKSDLVKIELTIGETDVKHNDQATQMDVAPTINAEAGRTELPLRYLGEALGFDIDWSDNNVVTITKDGVSFSLTIGQEIPGFGTPYVDAEAGRTMVSARYISEMLGANVIWDPVDRQVIVVK